MEMLRFIQKLWSAVYDLKMLIAGTVRDLDLIEYQCREYTVDDYSETE